ncbi:hypothetical protein LSAT2_028805, partial [Lamellibrachia satsuma]
MREQSKKQLMESMSQIRTTLPVLTSSAISANTNTCIPSVLSVREGNKEDRQ